MQYLAELVQHGLGISVVPPMSLRAVVGHVSVIRIDPPLGRDICAVTAAALTLTLLVEQHLRQFPQ